MLRTGVRGSRIQVSVDRSGVRRTGVRGSALHGSSCEHRSASTIMHYRRCMTTQRRALQRASASPRSSLAAQSTLYLWCATVPDCVRWYLTRPMVSRRKANHAPITDDRISHGPSADQRTARRAMSTYTTPMTRSELTEPDYLPAPRPIPYYSPEAFTRTLATFADYCADRARDILPSLADESLNDAMLAVAAIRWTDLPDMPERPLTDIAPDALIVPPSVGEWLDGSSMDPLREVNLMTAKHAPNMLGEVTTFRQRWHMYVVGTNADGSYGSISTAGALAMADMYLRATLNDSDYSLIGIEDKVWPEVIEAGEGMRSPCAVGSQYKPNGELRKATIQGHADRASASQWRKGVPPVSKAKNPKPRITAVFGKNPYYIVGRAPTVGSRWVPVTMMQAPTMGYSALVSGTVASCEMWRTSFRGGRWSGHVWTPKPPVIDAATREQRKIKRTTTKQAKAKRIIATDIDNAANAAREIALLIRLEQCVLQADQTNGETHNPCPEPRPEPRPNPAPRHIDIPGQRITIGVGTGTRLNIRMTERSIVDGKVVVGASQSSSVTSPDYARAWVANRVR